MKAKQLPTAHARAERIGVSRWTVMRVEKGGMRPGESFIAAVLDAFTDIRFEDVFEIEQVSS
ncbi:helix-turn-helix domain-containing protein [Nonomuraea pusilla]|nr:helix-turn-helix transcriptional regulator [Nonomuraea pusilla]